LSDKNIVVDLEKEFGEVIDTVLDNKPLKGEKLKKFNKFQLLIADNKNRKIIEFVNKGKKLAE
jgi:hypothetical protein